MKKGLSDMDRRRTIITIAVLAIVAGAIFYVRAGDSARETGSAAPAAAGGSAPKAPAKGPGAAGMQAPPPPKVGVVEIQPRDIPMTYDYVGTTEPSKKVE